MKNISLFELNDCIENKVPWWAYILHWFGIHYCRRVKLTGVIYCRICGIKFFQ